MSLMRAWKVSLVLAVGFAASSSAVGADASAAAIERVYSVHGSSSWTLPDAETDDSGN